MAKFKSELPYELMKVFEDLETNCEDMFGEMCKAGAEVVYNNVKANMKKAFKSTRSLEKGLKITKVYKTPSDDGINVHIGFYGYADSDKPVTVKTTRKKKNGKATTYSYERSGVPIPLIAMAREYGTSKGEKKKPFFRQSFKKKEIEQAMQEVQDKYIKGD